MRRPSPAHLPNHENTYEPSDAPRTEIFGGRLPLVSLRYDVLEFRGLGR